MSTEPGIAASSAAVEPSGTVSNLLRQIQRSLATMSELERHRAVLSPDALRIVKELDEDCRRRLARKDLNVCIVGEQKVGKSTFLNALLGRALLGVAVKECTGTVTFLRYGPRPQYQAHLVDGTEESFATVCPDRHDTLTTSIDDAKRHVRESAELIESLPLRIKEHSDSIAANDQLLTELQGELTKLQAAEAALQEEQRRLAHELSLIKSDVQSASRAVPFYYRKSGSWWQPWLWLPRMIIGKSIRNECKAHFDRVREMDTCDKDARSMAQTVSRAYARVASVQARIQAQDKVKADLLDSLSALRKQVVTVPEAKASWRAKAFELESERELHAQERLSRFESEVRRLTDIADRAGSVTELHLTFPSKWLARGIVVIDTPGVNTDNDINRERAWNAIRREADGCIIVSDLQQAMTASTRQFIQDVRSYVPHLILVLTKVDKVLAGSVDPEEAQKEMEEARRVGERRFAADIGRDPEDIISFAVAAKPALQGDDALALAGFEAAVEGIARVLSRERILIAAARCGVAITKCNAEIAQALERAETGYRNRIQALEQQRLPDPMAFCRDQIRTIEGRIRPLAQASIECGKLAYNQEICEGGKRLATRIWACDDAAALKSLIEDIDRLVGRLVSEAGDEARTAMTEAQEEEFKALEQPLIASLQERYRIARAISGGSAGRVKLASIVEEASMVDAMGTDMQSSMSGYRVEQAGGAAVGAAIGATFGSVVPILGTAAGALVGGVIGFFVGPDLDKVKSDCIDQLAAAMDATDSAFCAAMDASETKVVSALRAAIASTLTRAINDYAQWIEGLIKREQQELMAQRTALEHLVSVGNRMQEHRGLLNGGIAAAAQESTIMVRHMNATG